MLLGHTDGVRTGRTCSTHARHCVFDHDAVLGTKRERFNRASKDFRVGLGLRHIVTRQYRSKRGTKAGLVEKRLDVGAGSRTGERDAIPAT